MISTRACMRVCARRGAIRVSLISPYLNGVLQHFVAHVDDHLIFVLFKVLSAQEMLGLNNAA